MKAAQWKSANEISFPPTVPWTNKKFVFFLSNLLITDHIPQRATKLLLYHQNIYIHFEILTFIEWVYGRHALPYLSLKIVSCAIIQVKSAFG